MTPEERADAIIDQHGEIGLRAAIAIARAEAAEAEVARLREALEPFIRAFEHVSVPRFGVQPSDIVMLEPKNLKMVELWLARAALEAKP